jgi:hypothetical protein
MEVKDKIQLHVGQLLSSFYKSKKISRAAMGRALGVQGSAITYHHTCETLNTRIILNYSVAFKHNFFLDLAALLPKEFTTNAPQAQAELAEMEQLKAQINTIQLENNRLQQELNHIQSERDLLKEIMMSRGV